MLQQDQRANLLRRARFLRLVLAHARVSFRAAAARCASGRCRVRRYLGVERGREKDVACRENVGARETFCAKCPLVHLRVGRPNERTNRRTGELRG